MTAPLRLATHAPTSRSKIRLGMAQLSPWGLAEQWVLRELGDRHWSLIADAVGQAGTAFHDAEGHPVYAAFCATSVAFAPATAPLLGTELEILSRLAAVGPNRLGSVHSLQGATGALGQVLMISCFLRHDATRANHRLLRSSLPGLGPLPLACDALAALNARARTMARRARDLSPRRAELLRTTPLPALDFNAAGLLYFPTFSKIAEMAQPSNGPLARRDITYLGNLNPGDPIAVHTDTGDLILSSGPRTLAVIQTDAL